MNTPILKLYDLKNQPNIDNAGLWESGGEGRIMLYPEVYGEQPTKYEWSVIDTLDNDTIAEGVKGTLIIRIFKKWVNNVMLWNDGHWEVWDEHGHENMKFGFRIKDILKPIGLTFRVKATFEKGYYGIWEKTYSGIVKIHEDKDWGEVGFTNTKLIESNFEDDEDDEWDDGDDDNSLEQCLLEKNELRSQNEELAALNEYYKKENTELENEIKKLKEPKDIYIIDLWKSFYNVPKNVVKWFKEKKYITAVLNGIGYLITALIILWLRVC